MLSGGVRAVRLSPAASIPVTPDLIRGPAFSGLRCVRSDGAGGGVARVNGASAGAAGGTPDQVRGDEDLFPICGIGAGGAIAPRVEFVR